jgi:hypothetical protein
MHFQSGLLCIVLLASASLVLAQTAEEPCYMYPSGLNKWAGNLTQVVACLNAVPFNSAEHPATIAAIRNVFKGYSFADIVRASVAPYSLNVDFETTITSISEGSYSNDYAPHAALSALFNRLGDAHIVYYAPLGYGQFRYYMPYSIRSVYSGGSQKFYAAAGPLSASLYNSGCSNCAPGLADNYGLEITAIDGVSPATWLAEHGAAGGIYVDAGVQMNNILASTKGSFSLAIWPLPAQNNIVLTIGGSDVSIPYLFTADYELDTPADITTLNHYFPTAKRSESTDGYGQNMIAELEVVAITHLHNAISAKRSARDATTIQLLAIAEQHLQKLVKTRADSAAHGALFAVESSKRSFSIEEWKAQNYVPLAHVRMAAIDAAITAAFDLESGFDRAAADAATSAKIQVSLKRQSSSAVATKSSAAATEVPLATGDRTLFESFSNSPNANVAIYNNTVVLKLKGFDTESNDFESAVINAHTLRDTHEKNLVIDMTNNGGGIICLNYGALNYMVGPWRSNEVSGPNSLYSPYEWRITPLTSALWDNDYNWYFGNTHVNPATGAKFGNDVVTSPRSVTHGSHTSDYTKLFNWDLCGRPNPAFFFTPSSTVLPFDKIIVITDGRCGSSCAYFISHLRYSNKVRVVSYGGVSGSPMATSSFAGGNVYQYDSIVGRARNQGYATSNGIAYMEHNAYTSFNFRANYDPDATTIPRQFERLEADWHINYWDPLSVALWSASDADGDVMANLYSTVLPLFNDMPSGLTGTPAPSEAPTGAAASVAPMFTLSAIVAFVFAVFF